MGHTPPMRSRPRIGPLRYYPPTITPSPLPLQVKAGGNNPNRLTSLIIVSGVNNPNDNPSNRVSAPNPRTGRDCNVTLVLAFHHREAPMMNPTNRIHGSDDLSNASQNSELQLACAPHSGLMLLTVALERLIRLCSHFFSKGSLR